VPIPSSGLVRRQRTTSPLTQSLPVMYQRYSNVNGGPIAGWTNTKTVQLPTKSVGNQVTDSEEHSGWRKRLKDAHSLSDVGGDFFTQKRYLEGIPSHVQVFLPREFVTAGAYLTQELRGPVWSIDARLHGFPPSLSSTNTQLDVLGATAVARCKPTNSRADIAVTLGELVREGIPKLAVHTWKPRATTLRALKKSSEGVADDYLAFQFGLAPLGQEIGSFAGQVLQADRLLEQYERDAGKVVRRRYEFPTKTETSLTTTDAGYPVYMGIPFTGTLNPSLTESQHRSVQVLRETVQKRWFAGAFTYYLPPWYDARSEMSRKALLAKEILGLDIDLDVIWNLTPWSWAVDWFSNAGDVINNINSVLEDGLIMRYGYMMEHTIVKDTYTRTHPNTLRNGSVDSRVTLVTETKIRRRANPFGFGLTWDGLSTFQASILAALGITRSR